MMDDESIDRWARLAKFNDDDEFETNERVEIQRRRREEDSGPAATIDRPTETRRRPLARRARLSRPRPEKVSHVKNN